ncbi:MAG: TIGR03089 family protein, partial [Micrococcales bacterium]|nr:TIGR03089 family protein [Micrococcales bacterium]
MSQWNQRLAHALATNPGRPRVTWYADGGQRVELSGATCDNWATKTANYLLDEADANPGVRIALDMPVHWRTVCWALGAWRTGACVVVPGACSTTPEQVSGVTSCVTPADIVVTTNPVATPSCAVQVAVALPPLARQFDGPLHGALDAAATLLAQPDMLGPVAIPAPDDPALADPTTLLTYAELAARPARAAQRVLRPVDPHTSVRLDDLLTMALLADGGSLVLVTTDHPAAVPGP